VLPGALERELSGDPKFRDVIAAHEAMLRDYEATLIAGREFTRK